MGRTGDITLNLEVDPVWSPLDGVFLRAISCNQGSNAAIVVPYAYFVTAVTDGAVLRLDVWAEWIIGDGYTMTNLLATKGDLVILSVSAKPLAGAGASAVPGVVSIT